MYTVPLYLVCAQTFKQHKKCFQTEYNALCDYYAIAILDIHFLKPWLSGVIL